MQKESWLCVSSAEFPALFSATTAPLVMFRVADGTILYTNKNYHSTFGLPGEGQAANQKQTIYSYTQQAEVDRLLLALYPQGFVSHFELKLHSSRAVASLQLLTIKGEQAVLAIFPDISLQAIDPHSQALDDEAVRASTTFKTLMSNLPGMVYRSRNDKDWTKEFVSVGCYQLTGYSAAELIGNQQFSYAQLIHPDDREQVWHQVQAALQELKTFQLCYRIATASGEEKWVWEQGQGIFTESGELLALEGFITDITQTKRAEEEIRLLQTTMGAHADAEDFHSALGVALRKFCEATGWDYGEAWIPNSEGILESSSAWYNSTPILEPFRQLSLDWTFAPGKGLPGKVAASGQPEWIPDVSNTPDGLFLRAPIAQLVGLKAGFGVPIICNQKVLAVLAFFMFESRQKDKRLIDLVSCVAAQLGTIIQRKQCEIALQEAELKYRSIFENAIEGIFQTTADGHYICANPALARLYGYSSPAELMTYLTDIEHQLYVKPNRRAEFIGLLQKNDIVCEFESQVYRRDGSVIWISENARAVRSSTGALLYYEGTVEDITQRVSAKEQLHERAFSDALTNLANRALFMERLLQAVEQAKECLEYKFAVLYLDLDDFKLINDRLGHLIGDRLLVELARRLKTCVRSHDLVARLGGDEFTILLVNVLDISKATTVAKRIHQELSIPFHLDEHEVSITISIGIALGSGFDSSSCTSQEQAMKLLRTADSALYRAKNLGKGRLEVLDTTY